MWELCGYYGWTPEYVWWTLDYHEAMSAYAYLPNLRYKDNFAAMFLNYQFRGFAGGFSKNSPALPPFEEFLQPWMRLILESKGRAKDAPYSPLLAADVTLAFNLHILSQRALVALRPNLLRKSGAFPKEEE